MPAVLFFLYLICEALAFWLVSAWIGTGWALVAFFATMFLGMVWAGFEIRRLMSSQVVRGPSGHLQVAPNHPGRTASNLGLTVAGGALVSAPGFVSFVVGALLIFPPTRALIRRGLARGMFRSLENMGVRLYEASPMSQNHDFYGSFADGDEQARPRSGNPGWHPSQAPFPQPGEQSDGRRFVKGQGGVDDDLVIDEEEIRKWSESARPEDFGDDGKRDNN